MKNESKKKKLKKILRKKLENIKILKKYVKKVNNN